MYDGIRFVFIPRDLGNGQRQFSLHFSVVSFGPAQRVRSQHTFTRFLSRCALFLAFTSTFIVFVVFTFLRSFFFSGGFYCWITSPWNVRPWVIIFEIIFLFLLDFSQIYDIVSKLYLFFSLESGNKTNITMISQKNAPTRPPHSALYTQFYW